MGFTVFLGNLPTWVAAEDIESWLASENLAADSIKVIRDHETQESKGFAFVEAPNAEETNITSCTFGGGDYRTLYATSASLDTTPGDLLAGGLFAIRTEVAGRPENRFRSVGRARRSVTVWDRACVCNWLAGQLPIFAVTRS
jgi:hypothetical protein